MGRRPRVDRTPEEKWRMVQEGIKSGHRLGDVPATWHFTVTVFARPTSVPAGQSSPSRISLPKQRPHPLLAQRMGHPAQSTQARFTVRMCPRAVGVLLGLRSHRSLTRGLNHDE
jgi:hypothetical protein